MERDLFIPQHSYTQLSLVSSLVKIKSFDLNRRSLVSIWDIENWWGKSIWLKKRKKNGIQLWGRKQIQWERGKETQTFLGVFTHVHINMVLLKMWCVDGRSSITVTWESLKTVDSGGLSSDLLKLSPRVEPGIIWGASRSSKLFR